MLQVMAKAIQDGERKFPSSLGIHILMSECSVDKQGQLHFRGRRWIPEDETLCTRIVQEMHDSVFTGHPGREMLYKIVT